MHSSMPDRTSDILVVGCGPSGLVAAALLARAGHRVTAIDSAEEPAPRGPLVLTRPGIAVLAELEWVDDLRSLTGCSTSSELVLGCPGSSVVVSDRWEMVTVARSTALELFADRALMLGVTLMHGYTAVAPLWEERRVVGVRARDSRGVEHTLSAKAVVDASGPSSFLAGALGKLLPHRGAPRCRVVGWLADGAPEKPALAIAHGHWVQTLPSQGGEVVAVVHCDSDPPGDPEVMIDRCVGFLGEVVPPRATGCAVVAQRVGTSLLAQAGDGWIAVGEAAGCGSPGSPGTTSTGLAVASTAAPWALRTNDELAELIETVLDQAVAAIGLVPNEPSCSGSN